MSIVPRPLFHYTSDQYWTTQSNLTIIGDAAHRMPPYAGEGVNMAMLDALELSEEFLHTENIKSAFENYETKMFERAKEVTAITMKNTVELHEPNGLKYILVIFNSFNQ